ncbi:MAG: hypothetical protein AAED33_12525 [Paracoccaceae bacterium]
MTDSLEETRSEWQLLLEDEEQLFIRACEIDRELWGKHKVKSEAVREWWSAANAILWKYVRTHAQHNIYLEPMPAYTMARLANIAEELSNGNVPSFVSDAAISGRPRWRKQRHHIAYAIYYIEAATRGEIKDTAYNKTVREIYGVTSRAVQKWLEERDKICIGVPIKGYSPELIEKKMRESGAIYDELGPGIGNH